MYIDEGHGFQAATAKGRCYDKRAAVLDECYTKLKAVRLQNTGSHRWIGSVAFAHDKTGPYIAGSCPTCTGSGNTSRILVQGDNHASDDYNPRCLNGKMCGISLPLSMGYHDRYTASHDSVFHSA